MNSKHFAAAGALFLCGTVAYVVLHSPSSSKKNAGGNWRAEQAAVPGAPDRKAESESDAGSESGSGSVPVGNADAGKTSAGSTTESETQSMAALPAEEPSRVPEGEPTADELKVIDDLGGEEPEQNGIRDWEFHAEDMDQLLRKLDENENAALLEFRLRFGFSNRQLIEIRRLNARRKEALARRGLSPDDTEAIERRRADAIIEMLKTE